MLSNTFDGKAHSIIQRWQILTFSNMDNPQGVYVELKNFDN